NDRVKGLIAGNSLEMPTTGGETNEEIIKAVKSGEISEDVLDENLDRLLNLVFDTSKAVNASKESFDKEKHHLMAQKVAEESMVLLKNDNALPLNNKEKVAVIGDFAKTPRYQGAGSSIVNPTKLDNTIDVIADFDINYIGFEPGYNRYGKKSNSLIKKALKLAEQAETILLYIGLDEFSEVEGLDRKDMLIPSNQLELFNSLKTLNKKIVVVLACGSAIEMDFADDANAILHTYLSGQAGAKAALNILTGKINPSGKLSETHPFKYEDTPTAKYFPGKEVTAEYKEGLYVGYRYFDTNNVKVRYPFGYGLSYTSFEYSDLEVNKNEVTFKIKNTGKFSGKEIAQVYVKATNSKVYRPEKELKGFVKVDLKANETKTVSVKLGEDAFKFFNPDSMKWEVEKLQYEILVGASSTDIRLKSKLDVDGINIKTTLDLKDIPSYKSGKIQDVTTAEFEKILGREVPKSTYNFYKKNRLVVGYNTTVDQLRYSRRWVGRAFSGGIRFAIKLLHGLGKREAANTLAMGVVHLPMRGMAHMSGGAISWGQLDGLIMMFNGHFFKGFGKFLKEGRIK
ncbi:MAG: glycoside hydrolase family 3 C-terminal domain-containing protein, partial [Candidatus Izemoplasmatales bacterium]